MVEKMYCTLIHTSVVNNYEVSRLFIINFIAGFGSDFSGSKFTAEPELDLSAGQSGFRRD